ncbi:hypothetical protein GGS20DRAFT_422800 [Poronia punctata]|nr:hypothetical protein GGS20DRAFT_422800 [Poronia punctata]
MYATHTPPPPIPPPKPSSHDVSRLGTPVTDSPRRHHTVSDHGYSTRGPENEGAVNSRLPAADTPGLIPATVTPGGGAIGQPSQPPQQQQQQEPIPDPGDTWLPKILEDKSKQDLAEILGSPSIIQALTMSPTTMHPSLKQSQDSLLALLDENVKLAQHLTELEGRLANQRASTQAQLLSAHALDRQWRAKQSDMDMALAPFAPAAHYNRLTQALQEQEMLCAAMEESFLEGGAHGGSSDDHAGANLASEREILDWVRRYREARRLYYLRQERKERWNERRVGGWR